MTDNDMLDLLAADAPAPAPGYADGMLERARRSRWRRNATGLGAALSVAAVAVATAVVLAPPANDRLADGPPTSGAATTSVGASQPGMPPAAEVMIYATAVESLAEAVRGGGPPVLVLYILDHTCTNIMDPLDDQCEPEPVPTSLREDLTRALSHYAPVEFIADGHTVTGRDLEVLNGGVVVTLGPIELRAATAQVPLSVRRGGLNGQGLTYVLSRSGAAWSITGTTGPQWIS